MKNYIYIKINTLPLEEDIQPDSEQFVLFKKTYQEAREYMSDKDVIRSYQETAGRSPVFSKINSISVAYVNGKEARINVLEGEEKDIIVELFNLLNSEFFKDSILVSWNFDFLLGFFKLRPLACGINVLTYPAQITDAFNKEWSRKKSIDVFSLVNPGWSKISAINVFHTFGLAWEDILSGDDLYLAHRTGDRESILNGNRQFIFNLINTHRILIGEDRISEIIGSVKQVGQEVETIDDRSFLEKLNEASELDNNLREEFLELVKGKKITKKDKENLFTILRGVWVQTDFINQNQDSKKVIEVKEEEIRNLLNEI